MAQSVTGNLYEPFPMKLSLGNFSRELKKMHQSEFRSELGTSHFRRSRKLLVVSSGIRIYCDHRLTDSKRRTPFEWAMLQLDEVKRRSIKDFLDWVCAFKSGSSASEMLSELGARIGIGNGKNVTSSSATESIGTRILRAFICCPSAASFRKDDLETWEVKLNNSIEPLGFGIDQRLPEYCRAVMGLPFLNEISDLKPDEDPTSASWICGKFSTFVPMLWRSMAVSVRELRKSTVDDTIPDILIAELNILAKLRHPKILMILAVCHVDNYDSISLIFEKVSLGSLHFLLYDQSKRLSSRFVAQIISDVCDGLDFMHKSGYSHCFVNSHSIHLMEYGPAIRAKLGSLEYTTPFFATPEPEVIQVSRHPHLRSDNHLMVHRHWAAPEVITGKRPQSTASDIYSICCVMWETIYCEVPWKYSTLEELRLIMSETPYARLPLDKVIVPDSWYGILNVGLEPEASLRDIDLTEVRDMMKLSQSRIDVVVGPSGDGGASCCTSLKSYNDPVVPSQDPVDNHSLSDVSLPEYEFELAE